MKYHLVTYGCQMNTADSEEMAQPLASRGFTATAHLQDADIVLMNTCTVREQAEHRAQSNLGRLRLWKQEKPHRILIVAGCAASRWGDSIKKRYPYIDLVAPATQIDRFPELVQAILKERWNWEEESALAGLPTGQAGSEQPAVTALSNSPLAASGTLFGDDSTGYVTIMRGCNYSCSYCIVPQVRGREVYRSPDDILNEIKTKVIQGKREMMLLGQTVNSYSYRASGSSAMMDFADLLRAVDALEGVERIRFMSPHPRHMRDRVISAMHDSAKVCRHIHLPLQSGSNTILERMQRLYTRELYKTIVQKLRQAMPELMITTDVIVGYPGETDADLTATLDLMEEIQFDGLFAFKFSARPGTAATKENDDVPNDIKEHRLQQVLSLNKRIQKHKHKAVAA